jgi:triosephosphate isomerase
LPRNGLENRNPKCIVAAQNCNQHSIMAPIPAKSAFRCFKPSASNWCIIGHSERRGYDNETSEKCNAKIKALLAAG